jgi:hypothetical protein
VHDRFSCPLSKGFPNRRTYPLFIALYNPGSLEALRVLHQRWRFQKQKMNISGSAVTPVHAVASDAQYVHVMNTDLPLRNALADVHYVNTSYSRCIGRPGGS